MRQAAQYISHARQWLLTVVRQHDRKRLCLTGGSQAQSWQIRGQVAARSSDRSRVYAGKCRFRYPPECWTNNPSIPGPVGRTKADDLCAPARLVVPAVSRTESAIWSVSQRSAWLRVSRTVTAGDGQGGLMVVTFWLLRLSIVTATAAR